jgi:hypothetical protein
MAQFGLTETDVYATGALRGYFFDQYVRACGFTPKASWVFVVLPNGECEYSQLEPGEPLWCCENRTKITARVSTSTSGIPPWAEGFVRGGAHGRVEVSPRFQP